MAKLLLVDDDVGTLGWMTAALVTRGHDVRGCSSPADALALLREWPPDLVISDIVMPDMDGLTFARLCRRRHGVPVMFVSIAKRKAEAVIVRAIGYVSKPATADEVRAAVERVLGRRAKKNAILVVNDDPDVCELYRTILEPHFTVYEAEHGAAALELMETTPVDLAIVDVYMPVMDGLELIERMRATPGLASLPVIVQTSDPSALASPAWRDLDVSQLLTKSDFFSWLSRQIESETARDAVPTRPHP